MKTTKSASILLALLSCAGLAMAQQQQGPDIEGNVKMTIESAQNLNAAVGNESTASQAIGAIESGSIKGDLTMTIEAQQNLNAAVGNKSCADQQIGTIGKASSCK